jgi:IclR family transcriptional regulator, pca regulon regulatory protein
MPEPPRPSYHVQSLDRGLSVIRAFGPDRAEQTLSDVARTAGLTRSTARRFLLTMVDLGYMRTDGKLFRLTPRVLDLGYAYLSSMSLLGIAEPHLELLVAETGESSSVSVLDRDDIVYVARVPTSRIMAVAINVGTRFPAYATAMGRVLLAGMDEDTLDEYLSRVQIVAQTRRTVRSREDLRALVAEVRSLGYALVSGELEDGLRALAVPIRNKDGRVVAAANVASLVGRITLDRVKKDFLPALLRCAAAIEADLRRT